MADTKRRIRFGLTHDFPGSAEAWRDLARRVEGLGYSTLLVSDHMGRRVAPLPAALAAALATTRLRVGTQVLANHFRNPSVLAKEVATIDVLTGGRFELGIGTGWPATSANGRADYAQTGLPVEESGPRVSRLIEAVAIIKACLSGGEPFDFRGRFYQVEGLLPFPRPVQSPRPPIMVAGAGPRMLRFAGAEADIVNIAPRPPTLGPTARGSMAFGLTIRDELAIIREAAGRRYGEVELCVFADRATITNDPDAALETLAKDFGVDRAAVEAMPHTLTGSVEQVVDTIERNRDEYDVSYYVIPGALIEAFAPVVRRLAGT